MRVVIQKVSQAQVKTQEEGIEKINRGLLLLLGVEDSDDKSDIDWLIRKVSQLKIFEDEENQLNKSVMDICGEILVVSQFTLFADTKKGLRPSYSRASKQNIALPLHEKFLADLKDFSKLTIKKGVFGAHMDVTLTNEGPLTIIIDSKNKSL